MTKDSYVTMRNRYRPAKLNSVFVLESPPASGKYFYNEEGRVTEPLFSGMMRLMNFKPSDKREGLEQFAEKGYFLVDATYRPVNKRNNKNRNAIILQDFGELLSDLRGLGDPRVIKIILVKANVCRLLEPKLISEGFNVRNNGKIIPFPACGHQTRFLCEAGKVITEKN